MNFACYCLVSSKGKTYVGFTVNVDRRLRQHNGELCGGAKATRGDHWTRVCAVTGFPTQQAALQFEWKWKHLSRKIKGCTAVERRYRALEQLVNSERSTSQAMPFCQYEGPLLVLAEDAGCTEYFRHKDLQYAVLIE
jgi:structure-specific endonuclease subunit SLX1